MWSNPDPSGAIPTNLARVLSGSVPMLVDADQFRAKFDRTRTELGRTHGPNSAGMGRFRRTRPRSGRVRPHRPLSVEVVPELGRRGPNSPEFDRCRMNSANFNLGNVWGLCSIGHSLRSGGVQQDCSRPACFGMWRRRFRGYECRRDPLRERGTVQFYLFSSESGSRPRSGRQRAHFYVPPPPIHRDRGDHVTQILSGRGSIEGQGARAMDQNTDV